MRTLAETMTKAETVDKDRIVVTETVFYELKASSAVLHVSVKGTSYFADDMALKKAKEVSSLVDALKELGIPDEEIRLKNVVADSQSGIISKTSSAKYHLSIKCRELEKLSEALSVITNGKNCELHKLDWQFMEDREKKLNYLSKAFTAAKETAECMANSLGIAIAGVNDCGFDEFIVYDYDHGPGAPQVMAMKSNISPDYESLAMSRNRAAPSLPSGQWQKQGIRARVVFLVGNDTRS
jgi:uncharacterized protein YggE